MIQKFDLIENAGYWQTDPNAVMTTLSAIFSAM